MRLGAAVIALALAPHASATPTDALPQDVVGVGVTERLDGQVPLDLPLVDEAGGPTTLGAVRRTDRPLVLVLGYYECPMLCTVVLNGVVEALRGIEWVPGREFDVVMLSIDPEETPDLARQKRETYLAAYGRPAARDGWRFLTGPQASIDAIAAAVGFEYRYLPERDEFAHPAVVFVLDARGQSRALPLRRALRPAHGATVARRSRRGPHRIDRRPRALGVLSLRPPDRTLHPDGHGSPAHRRRPDRARPRGTPRPAVAARRAGRAGRAAQGARVTTWLPEQASTHAAHVDFSIGVVFWISVFFLALISFLLVWFVVRYRERPGYVQQPSASHNTPLEIFWSVVPTLIVAGLFWSGYKAYLDLATPPAGAYDVQVTGQKWNWLFTYPNGYVDGQLHVPRDTPVRLVMTSQDVIHALFVPAFRVKRDVMPGRYSYLWFEATATGTYRRVLRRVLRHEPLDDADEGRRPRARRSSSRGSPRPRISSTVCPRPKPAGCCTPSAAASSATRSTARRGSARRSRASSATSRRWPRARPCGSTRTTSASRSSSPRPRWSQGFEPVMPSFKGRLQRRGDHGDRRVHQDPRGHTMSSSHTTPGTAERAPAGARRADGPRPDNYLHHTPRDPLVAVHARSQAHRRHVPRVDPQRVLPRRRCSPCCVRTELLAPGKTIVEPRHLQPVLHAARRGDGVPRSSSRASRRRSATSSCRSCSARRTSRSRGSTCSASTSGSSARCCFVVVDRRSAALDTGWTFYTPYSTTTTHRA